MLVACLSMLVACGRSESARRERCRELAVSRNEIGADPVGNGKVLLEFLRCNLHHDTLVFRAVLDEMSRVCGRNRAS